MKNKILIICLIVFTLGCVIYLSGKIGSKNKPTAPSSTPSGTQQDNKPQIVSTKPKPLEEAIISATQVIEITFNRPLENIGEFKNKIEPKVDYKVELSADRKTARIIPTSAFELGSTYTLSIGTETKFDGVGRWGEEKIFHFKTIKYTGV